MFDGGYKAIANNWFKGMFFSKLKFIVHTEKVLNIIKKYNALILFFHQFLEFVHYQEFLPSPLEWPASIHIAPLPQTLLIQYHLGG